MFNSFKNEKGNVNFKAIVIIITILIVLGFLLIFLFSRKEKSTVLEKIPYEYFLLSSIEDKVGVIDKKGNKVIDTKYTDIYIPNQSKDVFICIDEDGTKILNKDGKEIFKDFENVEPIMISEDILDMEKYILSYKKDEKYGLVNIDGQKITEAIYDKVSSLSGKPGNILVKKDDLYGVIDSTGKEIIETKYNFVKSDEYYVENEGYTKSGYIISEKKKDGIYYGYADYLGKVLVDTKYEDIKRANVTDPENIYLIVMERGKKGVLENGKKLIDNNFQSINYYPVSEIFAVEKTGKYGFYTLEGKEILKPEFAEYKIAGEYISVKKDGKTLLYDVHGNVVNTANYVTMTETKNPSYFIAKSESGYFSIISKDVTLNDNYVSIDYAFDDYFIVTKENEKTQLINVWTGPVINPEYEYILVIEGTNMLEARKADGTVDIYSNKIEKILTMSNGVVQKVGDNYTVVYSDTEMKYLDKDGNFVENTVVFPNNKLYSINKDGKWGFVNSQGEMKVANKYDMVTELNEYGFAGIKQDNKWGVIDETGKVIVVPSYEIEYYYFPQFVGEYLLQQSETIQCLELKK